MESMWAQLLVGFAAVLGPLVGAGLGAVLLAYTPLRRASGDSLPRRPHP
jgi:hypothetical protein